MKSSQRLNLLIATTLIILSSTFVSAQQDTKTTIDLRVSLLCPSYGQSPTASSFVTIGPKDLGMQVCFSATKSCESFHVMRGTVEFLGSILQENQKDLGYLDQTQVQDLKSVCALLAIETKSGNQKIPKVVQVNWDNQVSFQLNQRAACVSTGLFSRKYNIRESNTITAFHNNVRTRFVGQNVNEHMKKFASSEECESALQNLSLTKNSTVTLNVVQ